MMHQQSVYHYIGIGRLLSVMNIAWSEDHGSHDVFDRGDRRSTVSLFVPRTFTIVVTEEQLHSLTCHMSHVMLPETALQKQATKRALSNGAVQKYCINDIRHISLASLTQPNNDKRQEFRTRWITKKSWHMGEGHSNRYNTSYFIHILFERR